MFFQELPGFSIVEFYPTNSLPLLSHIPVETNRTIANAEVCHFDVMQQSGN